MSYLELGGTMFRGELKAATGNVKFHLSAGSINAVDTINIVNGAVSYSQFFTFSKTSTANSEVFSVNANIKDNDSYLEVIAYCSHLEYIYVSGVMQNKHNAYYNRKIIPVIVVVPLNKGIHKIQMTSLYNGHVDGYLNLRYVRRTGSG